MKVAKPTATNAHQRLDTGPLLLGRHSYTVILYNGHVRRSYTPYMSC